MGKNQWQENNTGEQNSPLRKQKTKKGHARCEANFPHQGLTYVRIWAQALPLTAFSKNDTVINEVIINEYSRSL